MDGRGHLSNCVSELLDDQKPEQKQPARRVRAADRGTAREDEMKNDSFDRLPGGKGVLIKNHGDCTCSVIIMGVLLEWVICE